ncbi:MAG: TraB/GumN family protein [Phenylobacterium sp.]|uniref:TraB/GumN family protein n=1 Tax=Phenylobacterium sp. TaxID=1871053 RepID=UPI002717104C|nr:TraB/GumN family protein [Phenylobacterium sp.]MDO8900548.1 TraB/GumN family protein [Phenylobacterium sp.]
MRHLRGLFALILLALAGACAPPPAQAQPAVWIVRDDDSEMLLFGSIHLLPPGLDWRPAALDAALAQADDLWFELPVDPATEQEAARLALRLGVLPPGRGLYERLPEDSRLRLGRMAVRYSLPPTLLDQLKPWFAEVLLVTAMLGSQGADIAHGVEQQVSATAPPAVTRQALETVEAQLSAFDGVSLEEQLASLAHSLQTMEEDLEAFDRLVAAWMAGDLATLEAEALAPLEAAAPGLYRRLIVERNAAWLEQLQTRLDGSGRTVVVVGAGHLLGAEGLPQRLRALGYEVEGP